MDDEEEMEIPSPEDGSPGHFVIQGKPVISSPPQMVRHWIVISWHIFMISSNFKYASNMCSNIEWSWSYSLIFQVGGALPRLPPLPTTGLVVPSSKLSGSMTGGAYACSICMESFGKVGLLNKHIISKHSTGASLTPAATGSTLNR